MGRQRDGTTGVEGLHPADVNWLPNFEHPCHRLLAVIAEVKAQLQCSRLATYIIAPNTAVGEIVAWRRCPPFNFCNISNTTETLNVFNAWSIIEAIYFCAVSPQVCSSGEVIEMTFLQFICHATLLGPIAPCCNHCNGVAM